MFGPEPRCPPNSSEGPFSGASAFCSLSRCRVRSGRRYDGVSRPEDSVKCFRASPKFGASSGGLAYPPIPFS